MYIHGCDNLNNETTSFNVLKSSREDIDDAKNIYELR